MKKNFWCTNGFHFWKKEMPLVNKQGIITYDTTNKWRRCKKCNKSQLKMRDDFNWVDK